MNRILDENKEAIIAGDNRNKRLLTNKKMFSETSHHNSEDFKELGNLHKDKRSVEYYPSDGKHNFESKPQHFSKYDYTKGGLSGNHRVPDNLIGENQKFVRANTDEYNLHMAEEQMSYTTHSSSFPLTTNQDFHSQEVHEKAKMISQSKKNYKKKNVYNAYVNAMFNSGVFNTPMMDQC